MYYFILKKKQLCTWVVLNHSWIASEHATIAKDKSNFLYTWGTNNKNEYHTDCASYFLLSKITSKPIDLKNEHMSLLGIPRSEIQGRLDAVA